MKLKRFSLTCLLMLSLLVAGLIGCDSQESAAVKNSSGKGHLQGQVTMPLEGVRLYVYLPGMDLYGPAFAVSAATNENGKFDIELPDGDYFMFAGTGVGGVTMATTTPTDDFGLFAGNTVEESLSFTVPEPSSSLLALAACAALAVVVRRRPVRAH